MNKAKRALLGPLGRRWTVDESDPRFMQAQPPKVDTPKKKAPPRKSA